MCKPPHFSSWNSEEIVGYRLRYVVERRQQWRYLLGDFAFSKEISRGLTPRETYVVHVQAYNFLGGGPWSAPAFVFLEMGTELVLPRSVCCGSLLSTRCSLCSCVLTVCFARVGIFA